MKKIQREKSCNNSQSAGDGRLATWEKWNKRREAECKRLGKITDRSPVDLVMNILEATREDKQRKVVLEHAQIQIKPKIRGGTLWEQPLRLKQNCPCKPVYEVQKTASERGKPREVEHIGVPRAIQVKEMGVSGLIMRPACDYLDFDYISYRDRRENELQDSIKKLNPYKPEIDNLMVKGKKTPKPPSRKLPPLPVIIITEADSPIPDLTSICALKINNNIFFKEQKGQNYKYLSKLKENCGNNCTEWTYYFNVPVKRAGRSKLILENLGTVSLRYCWNETTKPIAFVTKGTTGQVFFFNKNEDILSPGQSRDIMITFFCDEPGFFNEIWELSICNCNFFQNSTEKFAINLFADATEDVENVKRKIKCLKDNIKQEAKINIIRSIIEDIVVKATTVAPPTYPYCNMLLEADIFVMKNPMCFYHQTEVEKMKVKYLDMTGDEWDLSVDTWRKAMMKKEYEKRKILYESLKSSYCDLLKPWVEGEELERQKYRAVKQLVIQLAGKFDQEFQRISSNIGKVVQDVSEYSASLLSETIHRILYMIMYNHIASTMEFCAGILSSLDKKRWIDLDFCNSY